MKSLAFHARIGNRPAQGNRRGDLYFDMAKGLLSVWSGTKWVKAPKHLRKFLPKDTEKVKIIPVDEGKE